MKIIDSVPYRYVQLYVLFFALVNLATQCNKEVIEFQYQFLEKVNIYPINTAYHINDTIWIEYKNADNKYFDQKANQRILIDSAKILLSIDYGVNYRINYNTVVKQNYCGFITSSNTQVDFYNAQDFARINANFGCMSTPHVKIGIVPKVKGNYKLYCSNQGYISNCTSKGTIGNPSSINYQFMDGKNDFFLTVE